MFPLRNYQYQIPIKDDLGAFGAIRKYDIHTGVDLYCKEGDPVYAMQEGVIIAIKPFTGSIAGFPWWNDTWAVAIAGPSGIINYGEIKPLEFEEGDFVPEGTLLGHVIPVLKENKGKVPSTSMLHIELYKNIRDGWAEWNLGSPKPSRLLDPTQLLQKELKNSSN
jgi:murein DD-endopeptidase MepM/ murein hydrolase activator NlpD